MCSLFPPVSFGLGVSQKIVKGYVESSRDCIHILDVRLSSITVFEIGEIGL
jgi:hypothetical protein